MDAREVQTSVGSQVSGGLRNPKSYWDFFDTPVQASAGFWPRDRMVDVDDVMRIGARFATTGSAGDPRADPPKTGYHPAFDRTFLGPEPWDLGPADGAIGLDEVFWAAAQFAHSCA
jgi:hypothetical protein